MFNMFKAESFNVASSNVVISNADEGVIKGSNVLSVSSINASDGDIPEGYIKVTMKLQGSDTIDALNEYLDSQEVPDKPVPVECEVMYEGDYVTKEELMKLAKAENISMTDEEAEEFLKQFVSKELTEEDLAYVAGGFGMPDNSCPFCPTFCAEVQQCVAVW